MKVQLFKFRLALAVVTAISPTIFGASPQPHPLRITEFCLLKVPSASGGSEYLEIHCRPLVEFMNAKTEGEFSYFLLMLENEGEEAGRVDTIIPLSGTRLSRKSYAWYYGSAGENYPADDGFQYEGPGAEESGCTLLVVAVPFGSAVPQADDDYDATTAGVAKLGGDWDPRWLVVDGVGVVRTDEHVERGGAVYARVNFAAGDFGQIATPEGSVNVNTTLGKEDEWAPFSRIDYVGLNRGQQWYAAALTNDGKGWSTKQQNYRIAATEQVAGDTHTLLPQCVDLKMTAPYAALQNITATHGSVAPCSCGKTSATNVVQTPAVVDGPEPTLAVPEEQAEIGNATPATSNTRTVLKHGAR